MDYGGDTRAVQGKRGRRLVAHLFIEPDGGFSVTPTTSISEEDEWRARVVTLGFAEWISIADRLLATYPPAVRDQLLELRRRKSDRE